jgi:hypothetical protein
MVVGWRIVLYSLSVLLLLVADASAQSGQARLGVTPADQRTCPATHPIKGNFTTYSGEPCIHHLPGGEFYGRTKPEKCYATEEEARRDGCRRSKR